MAENNDTKTHKAILDALRRRAEYDPGTILARDPKGEPITVLGMADALARGESAAVMWAEDVVGATVRMVGGRHHLERSAREVAPAPEVRSMKVDDIWPVEGHGTAITGVPHGPPRLGRLLRSLKTGQVWGIGGVKKLTTAWHPGMRCGFLLQPRVDGALPAIGDEMEVIEPMDLLARLEAAERRIAELEEQALEAENIALERGELD